MKTAALTRIDLNLREWEERRPEAGSVLRGLSFDSDLTRSMAADMATSGRIELIELRDGLSVRTTSYVGQLQLDRLNLSIRPKLPGIPLAALMRYAYGLHRHSLLPAVSTHLAEAGFQEMMVHQLMTETRELLSKGLHRHYVRQAQPLGSPRGRIDFSHLARSSGPIGERLICIDHPRSLNHLHNQVLKAGLGLAAALTQNPELRTQCRRLADMIGESVLTPRLDDTLMRRLRRQSNRLTAAYRPALLLIDLLRSGLGIDFENGERTTRLPGFLFDMNHFFQALISRFLHDHLDGYQVRDEYALRGMMEYRSGWNPNRRQAPTPRPDFVIQQGLQPVSTLDAKYRDLWQTTLPREMLYQLAIYALAGLGRRHQATILYPTTVADATEAQINIQDPLTRKPLGIVALRPVHLKRMADLIEAGNTPAARTARSQMAFQLAFGA